MANRDVVVIGASAGGVEALREIVAGFPTDFPAAVLVVLHVPSTGAGMLARVLDRIGVLPAKQAEHGDPLRAGTILVAPPDQHLVVDDSKVSLSRGPRENGTRPAVDVLFRSAAAVLGPRVVGVVLSGALDDGAAGMVAVVLRGGIGVVQDPDDAQFPSMPLAAMEAAVVEHVMAATKIPALLARLVGPEVADLAETSELMAAETSMATLSAQALENPGHPGSPSELTCPDCSGPLFEITEGNLTRYRCRVGHAWSPRSLAAEQAMSVENALWTAMETLEEKAALRDHLSRRAHERGHSLSARTFRDAAEQARLAATQLRTFIEGTLTEPEAPLTVEVEESH